MGKDSPVKQDSPRLWWRESRGARPGFPCLRLLSQVLAHDQPERDLPRSHFRTWHGDCFCWSNDRRPLVVVKGKVGCEERHLRRKVTWGLDLRRSATPVWCKRAVRCEHGSRGPSLFVSASSGKDKSRSPAPLVVNATAQSEWRRAGTTETGLRQAEICAQPVKRRTCAKCRDLLAACGTVRSTTRKFD